MDTVTHALAGTAIGYCGFRQRGGRIALWTSLAASQFPDADIVLNFIDPELYLRWHRGPTHSLFLVPVWAALLAWIFWEFNQRKNYRLLWLTAAVSLLVHIGLDWITSYGTMLLSPISDYRFALGWLFILDPYVWATLGLVVWAAIRTQQARVVRFGLGIFVAYILLAGVSQTLALRRAARAAPSSRQAAYPVPLCPWDWTIVAERSDGVHWLSAGQNDTFPTFADAVLRPQAEATSAVRTFRWFAAFPVVEELFEGSHTILRYRDLRFRTRLPWGEVSEGLFVVARVEFDRHGRLLGATLGSAD